MGLCGLPAPHEVKGLLPKMQSGLRAPDPLVQGWVWRSMAGGMARKRPQNRKNPRGPALLHALSSGLNPFGFPFYSNSVSGGLGVTGQRHTHVPRGAASQAAQVGAGGHSCCPFTWWGGGARGHRAQQQQNTAGTEQDCGPLLPRGHHTPTTGGGVGVGEPRGLCPAWGLGARWTVCEVQPCPGAQGRLVRPHFLAEAALGGGHPHPPFWSQTPAQREGPGGGKGRGLWSWRPQVCHCPAGSRTLAWGLPRLPGAWPGLSLGLATPGRTANTAHKARSTLRRPRPHFTGRETEAAGTSSYSPHPPGVAPAGLAYAPSSAPRNSGHSA